MGNEMMKGKFLAAAVTLLAAGCAETPDSGPSRPPVSPGIPEPPSETVEANVFYVEYFSDMDGKDSYFSDKAWTVARDFILQDGPGTPAVFFFDRMDFTAGEESPAVKICSGNRIYPMFAQQEATSDGTTRGCGIFTKTAVSDFDGITGADTFMSGPTLHLQLGIPGKTTFYTGTVSDIDGLKGMFGKKALKLTSDSILTGKIRGDIAEEAEEYISGAGCRANVHDTGKDWSLLTVCPPEYVCRGISEEKTVNLTHYRIKFEKIKIQ